MNTQASSSIGERIKQRRKELGLTQRRLAEMIGIKPPSLHGLESGRAKSPSAKTLQALVKALNTTAEWILEGKGPKEASEAIRHVSLECMPVITWEKEEDLEEHGEYVFVPRVDIKADCGSGSCVITEDVLDQRQAFRAEWFAQRNLKPQYCACIYATGDSMEPRIFEGDTLLIDRSPKARETIIDGKLYLLRYGDDIRVKQLFKRFDGGLIIRSFNREHYPDEEIPVEELAKGGIEVLGRVVWIGSEL